MSDKSMSDILAELERREAAIRGKTDADEPEAKVSKPRCPTPEEAAAANLAEVRKAGQEWRRLHGFGDEGEWPGT